MPRYANRLLTLPEYALGKFPEKKRALIARGVVPDMRAKARYRLEGAYAVDWAVRAVDTMFMLSGASGLYETGHVARAFRDAHAVKQHFSFNTDIAGTTYGRVALGLASDNPTL